LSSAVCRALILLAVAAAAAMGQSQPVSQSEADAGQTRRAWIGVGVDSATGLVVRAVVEGSPADRVGMRRGDVLVALGDSPATLDALDSLLRAGAPGTAIDIELRRDGAMRSVRVILEPPPARSRDIDSGSSEYRARAAGSSGYSTFVIPVDPAARGANAVAGADVVQLPPESIGRLRNVRGGVLIVSVDPDTPARRAGLAVGDVIVEAGGAAVTTVPSLRRAVAAGEGAVALTIVRRGERVSLVLRSAR
jgi:serine protease Do